MPSPVSVQNIDMDIDSSYTTRRLHSTDSIPGLSITKIDHMHTYARWQYDSTAVERDQRNPNLNLGVNWILWSALAPLSSKFLAYVISFVTVYINLFLNSDPYGYSPWPYITLHRIELVFHIRHVLPIQSSVNETVNVRLRVTTIPRHPVRSPGTSIGFDFVTDGQRMRDRKVAWSGQPWWIFSPLFEPSLRVSNIAIVSMNELQPIAWPGQDDGPKGRYTSPALGPEK
jgi:hypothetical protein